LAEYLYLVIRLDYNRFSLLKLSSTNAIEIPIQIGYVLIIGQEFKVVCSNSFNVFFLLFVAYSYNQ